MFLVSENVLSCFPNVILHFASTQSTFWVAKVFIFHVTLVPSGIIAFPFPFTFSGFLFKYPGKFKTISKLAIEGTVTTFSSYSFEETVVDSI